MPHRWAMSYVHAEQHSDSDADDWAWLNELCRATPASRQVGAHPNIASATQCVEPMLSTSTAAQTFDGEGTDDDDQWLQTLCRAPCGSASVAAGDDARRLLEAHSSPASSGDAGPARSCLPAATVSAVESQLSQTYGPAGRARGLSVLGSAAVGRLTSRRTRFAMAARPTGRNLSMASPQIPEVPDPTQTPSWSSGEHMICPATGGSVLLVAQSRSSLAEQRPSIRRGHLMIWHFPLRPVGGMEWIVMCRAAEEMVEKAIEGQPTVFKIGLTSDPLHRWTNFTYGYTRDGYTSMTMLRVTVPTWAAALERHLIQRFQGPRGCQNQSSGGESTPHQPPVFVYVVRVPADELAKWQLARARAAAQHYD